MKAEINISSVFIYISEPSKSTHRVVDRSEPLQYLNSCHKPLSDECYYWCHNQLIRAIARVIYTVIKSRKYHLKKKTIHFLKAREKTQSITQIRECLLSSASDWQQRVEFGKELNFLGHLIHQIHILRCNQAGKHIGIKSCGKQHIIRSSPNIIW